MVKAGNETETNGIDGDNNNNNSNTSNNYNNMMDVFRWSLCKKPLPQTVMRSIGIPLPPDHLQVIFHSALFHSIRFYSITCSSSCISFLCNTEEIECLDRFWKKILIGKISNGHRLVFGYQERSILFRGFIFYPLSKTVVVIIIISHPSTYVYKQDMVFGNVIGEQFSFVLCKTYIDLFVGMNLELIYIQ